MNETTRGTVAQIVEARLRSFEAAERARDAEALLAHFAAVPEFHLYNDGARVGYDVMAAGVRQTFPTLRALEGGFSDLQVLVLGPEAALVTARFREAVTDTSGATTRACGAASWLWRPVDGEWRIVYGQVDHRPDTEAQAGMDVTRGPG